MALKNEHEVQNVSHYFLIIFEEYRIFRTVIGRKTLTNEALSATAMEDFVQ